MATLPTADKLRIWRGLSRWWSNIREPFSVSKIDLQAAVAAADLWIDNNSASYNSALPVVFRNNATASQKSLLLVAVVLMRFNVNMLKSIFSEVD